jgi:hypothetical protein
MTWTLMPSEMAVAIQMSKSEKHDTNPKKEVEPQLLNQVVQYGLQNLTQFWPLFYEHQGQGRRRPFRLNSRDPISITRPHNRKERI